MEVERYYYHRRTRDSKIFRRYWNYFWYVCTTFCCLPFSRLINVFVFLFFLYSYQLYTAIPYVCTKARHSRVSLKTNEFGENSRSSCLWLQKYKFSRDLDLKIIFYFFILLHNLMGPYYIINVLKTCFILVYVHFFLSF